MQPTLARLLVTYVYLKHLVPVLCVEKKEEASKLLDQTKMMMNNSNVNEKEYVVNHLN